MTLRCLFAPFAALLLAAAPLAAAIAAPPQPAYVSGAPSSGIAKFTAKQTIGAATSGTDYAPATSGSAILSGNGAGGFTGVTIGSGCTFTTGTLSCAGTGSGTVTTTGSPASGNLTKFSGASSVSSGDLSGVVITSGTLATSFSSIAADSVLANWTGSSAAPVANAYTSCPDTGGNHLNYVSGTGITCGTSGSGGAASITVNAQTGTTYTVLSGDQGKLVSFSNASAVTVTLPQATSSFGSGWTATLCNIGIAAVTITPTTSTIAGYASYTLQNGGCVQPVSDGTNYQVLPLVGFYGGTSGAGYSLNRPNSAASGGNQRGLMAVDLQLDRNAASKVASGQSSFIAGSQNTAAGGAAVALGQSNSASAAASIAIGTSNISSNNASVAIGDSSTASGVNSTAIGRSATASASNSTALGGQSNVANGIKSYALGDSANTNGNTLQWAFSGGTFNGPNQWRENILWNRTTGSSAVRLTADGGAAAAANVAAVFPNSALVYQVECIIHDETAQRTNTYTFGPSLITKAASAATTAMGTGNPAATAGPTSATALTLAAVPTVTADTTLGAFNISYTPPVGNTDGIMAVCRISGTEAHN